MAAKCGCNPDTILDLAGATAIATPEDIGACGVCLKGQLAALLYQYSGTPAAVPCVVVARADDAATCTLQRETVESQLHKMRSSLRKS